MTVDQAVSVEALAGEQPTRRGLTRILGPWAVAGALLSALVTFLVLAGLTPIAPTHWVVVSLLMVNALTGIVLVTIIGREVWKIVQARRGGQAASKLHIRIVGLFSVIAAAPAVLVAIVASVTLDRGLDTLFSTRTRAAIENSVIVADAYLRSQAQSLRSDVVLMAFDLARAKPVFDKEPDKLQQFLTFQASLRGLAAINVFDDRAKIVDKADIPVEHVFALPPPEALGSISDSEPQIVLLPDADYVAAAIKLREYTDRYLYVARLLDPRVLTQLRVTQASASEYAAIGSRRLGIQVAFALMYTVIALIVLLSAVWIGLDFANRLVAPIRRLIGAANVVSTGNLFVRVPVRQSEGDLAHLGETFNRMTQELRTQRDDIVRARDLINSRRRFTEAVLSGASAGVIGIDDHNQITILNRSAEKLVGCAEPDALGKPVTNIAPELVAILGQAQAGAQRLTQGQVTINRGGRERILQVRVTREQAAEAERGYVLTLDDITELVFAQRTSAWADVARRIAHEIKNPLTPIQLAAERLRRKYIKAIGDDTTVFEQCTDTIVRQVDDIKRMVDEFSRFARMPKPVIEADDVADAVRQAVFLLKVGHPDLDIKVEFAEDPMPARFDRRLISQAVTNVIKNATEAISAVPPETLGKGRIAVFVSRKGHQILVDVVDNGVGLPKENRSRLLEPYVTTREKGTGLGLAIVGRILEEHGGTIELRDAEEKIPGQRGAWVQIRFA
ncbi:MAG: PAS domain-containing sensor histidine kinase, partial [Pseudolabrys sp.]|nr:PAS domain-containing sensor histidine kinase [Pseudolabrys sp.]